MRWTTRQRSVQRQLRVTPEFSAENLKRLLVLIAGLPGSAPVELTASLDKGKTTFWLEAPQLAFTTISMAMPTGVSVIEADAPKTLSGSPAALVWRGQLGVELRTDDIIGGCRALLAAFSQSGAMTAKLTTTFRSARPMVRPPRAGARRRMHLRQSRGRC